MLINLYDIIGLHKIPLVYYELFVYFSTISYTKRFFIDLLRKTEQFFVPLLFKFVNDILNASLYPIYYFILMEEPMKIKEMQEVLDARFLYGEELSELDVQFVFSADMMSDVLAYGGKCSVLITGLCNPQVVRTAEMLDIVCIIFVRGKMPDENMLALAVGKGIAVLATEHYMFTTCGMLYEHGLRGGA